MRDEKLRDLLRDADAGWRLDLPATSEVVRQVREVDQRRRQLERVMFRSAAVVLLVALATSWATWRGRHDELPQENTSAPELAEDAAASPSLAEELAQLELEAARHMRQARRLIADRKATEMIELRWREDAELDPIDEVQERLETVAYRMIFEADQLRESNPPSERAIVIYRDIVRLFPQTKSGAAAREKLAAAGDPLGSM